MNHPYLVKKRLKPLGIRQFKHELVIPVYSTTDGKIQSLQFIAPNGSKRFLTGGKTKEGFYTNRPFHQSNDKRIIISEGWATSQSLAQQWHVQGWHVVCFNTGNMLTVAKAMRQRHPFAKIVIAADNDISGAGQVAAQLAAKAVGASVSMPEFTDDERAQYGKVSDWQDRWMIDQHNIKEVTRYAD
jgi:putative DNA primase/helicase